MSRPMLLSYLDDLVIEGKDYKFSYQIYETLIEKWLERESEKWKKSEQREQFKANLRKLARQTALRIYENWQSEGGLYLSKTDALQIAEAHEIDLKPDEVKGKSLLTCDPLLNWKFAHKSILEYFLALECIDNKQFAEAFKFAGMDMVKHFHGEMAPVYNGISFVEVKSGTFKMGDEHGDNDERPVHTVTLSDFYIGKTPVTQKQWWDIMGSNPSRFKDCDDCPVETVSWDDAQKFIEKLSAKTGMKFRLPSEAEWEYAARGGHLAPVEAEIHNGKYKYAGSDDLDDVGWYSKNSSGKTHPVAAKKPNELGLYDMSGNVYEWCLDKWHANYEGAPTDGSAWKTGGSSYRVLRGGCWSRGAEDCRSARRDYGYPADRDFTIGFRLVFVP
ncbi:formylglycine-generating enzyme family protein [candidate division KSB1 bacterium]|nr:formylglycine-generating enzyme family protein [candidate division KSB1 bacterium]